MYCLMLTKMGISQQMCIAKKPLPILFFTLPLLTPMHLSPISRQVSSCESDGFVPRMNTLKNRLMIYLYAFRNGDIMKGISPEAMHELRIHYEAICLPSPKRKREMTREFRRRIREHVLGIEAAKEEIDLQKLKTIPRHFRQYHDCNSTLFKGFKIGLVSKRVWKFEESIDDHQQQSTCHFIE
ncbi:uncharacterized protein LOC130297613 isoform X2 [Hyla sarda]|uniref:uncharacterized protein LOC130297613 isoform X2 n=3 Tax=Hyla sarda TaxID=327740 RepID=UPI0024C45A4D|nr:uncharacterized protein LOC130297613 isoform X2 [Hyla sarda]XP_056406261.1 uncharacterized protein LOC130297613 isoform X2 [Hyla sarda]